MLILSNRDVASAIILSDKWKDALSNETLDLNTGLRVTPMRKLIKKMPEVAEKVFNQCTTANTTNPDNPNYKITFNYEFLDDMYSNWCDQDSTDTTSTVGRYLARGVRKLVLKQSSCRVYMKYSAHISKFFSFVTR